MQREDVWKDVADNVPDSSIKFSRLNPCALFGRVSAHGFQILGRSLFSCFFYLCNRAVMIYFEFGQENRQMQTVT